MKTNLVIAGLLVAASLTMAQPKPKSKAEGEAVNAMLQAQNPDDKIKSVEALIGKYKDTEFKAFALEQAGEAAERKGDGVNAIIYGNRAIEADPKNYLAMFLVARQTAVSTHENDLDKDDKVKRTAKLVADGMATLNSSAKINPQWTDDQWAGFKKELQADAHNTLGIMASTDKKYDVSINEFKASLDSNPDPVTMVRLANTYNRANKPDDAIAMADKAMASPGLPDNVKKFAAEEKRTAEKNKAAKH